ncbi:MAG: hypothetical protein JWN56_2208 [Sphingobacteriales bacterium]|nr:hypothetical protein [Sphingobacteriales bacterium]
MNFSILPQTRKVRTLLRYFFTVIVAFSFLTFCNKNSGKPKYSTGKKEILALEKSILSYSDSINRILPTLFKHESLFYYLGNNSFYVTKYHDANDKNVLFVKHTHIGKQRIIEHSYYMNNGQTVLILTTEKNTHLDHLASSKRLFYNGAALISQYEKKGPKENQTSSLIYSKTTLTPIDWRQEVTTMEDALNQQGNFDLIFEGITEYPKAKYIILSRDKINTYRAPVRIEKEDELVTELMLNPERFRGRKLLITCKVKDKNEAIYISGKLK